MTLGMGDVCASHHQSGHKQESGSDMVHRFPQRERLTGEPYTGEALPEKIVPGVRCSNGGSGSV
ncbi:hypothetical protein ATR01nite_20450 [Acetobacter tropicalis]|uniref:Uncharacterized protein n=2 Tax=Acetobacter tropicalis TaxID=104102 RepID=A0A511FPX2_9PROT|nr:hypothetical protein ATR01nite_20450 [Acetobacter tropicalis]